MVGLVSLLGLAGASLLSSATLASGLLTDPKNFLLSPHWNITDRPQVRRYDWTATNVTAAPDGYTRQVIVINNQLPGPLVEANEGDTIEVTLHNKLNEVLTMHWHGMYQNGTNWMDGVNAVTQCGIPPGKSFTYRFEVHDQWGTFFWHAHSADLNSDGLRGPLIIHSTKDKLKRGRDYDRDQVIFVSDWYHNISTVIDDALATPQGYHSEKAAPPADGALINGVGQCSQPGCHNSPPPVEFVFPPNTRTRIRLVNGGNHAMFNVSMDQHPLKVIEADGTGVVGPTRPRVPMFPGQRYSVIVTTTAADAGKSFWFRGNIMVACFGYIYPGLNPLAHAIIRVPTLKGVVPKGDPTSTDWNTGSPNLGICQDPDPMTMVPLTPRDAGRTAVGRGFFRTMANPAPNAPPPFPNGTARPWPVKFYVNNVTFQQPEVPLLHELVKPDPGVLNSSQVSNDSFPAPLWYDIVLVNMDLNSVRAIHHPYHLHSLDMYIVAEGIGNPTDAELDALTYNWKNPLRRDTVTVPGGRFMVVRVNADTPGVWLLHCHIGFHLASGMAGVIIAQLDKIRNFHIPEANLALCRDYAASEASKKPKRSMFMNDIRDYVFMVDHNMAPPTIGAPSLRARTF